MQESDGPLYYVWDVDHIAYGPVDLPTLKSWINDKRVLADSWVFVDKAGVWMRASEVSELKILFRGSAAHTAEASVTGLHVSPKELQRVKLFAGQYERALESFIRYMEPMKVPPFTVLVRQGEPADAVYFVLQGELRAYLTIAGKETTLATLQTGDMFGEVALLDNGQRSASVAANQESLLLRLSVIGFNQITKEAPALSSNFSLELARSLAVRLRRLTKTYSDTIRFSRMA